MKKKVLAIVLSLCLVGTLLTGCGSSPDTTSGTASEAGQSEVSDGAVADGTEVNDTKDEGSLLDQLPETVGEGIITASPEFYSGIDLSFPYTVNMYLIGSTPNDWDDVLALMNEYLEPFNTELSVTFMSWSDYSTMYSLVLAGGEQVDMIFTAPWCYMFTEAAKGSFYELTEDFINTSMPLTAKYQAPESWDETTVSGKTIAVPSNQAQPQGKIVAVRQDLMEKYGFSELHSWDDYKEFMLTIAEKETPESGIYALAAAGDNNELWDVYRQQYDTFLALDSNYLDLMFEYTGGIPNAEEITLAYDTEAFRGYARDMKIMADAGCWSRSALTNTVTDDDAFGNLQAASVAWNTSVFTYIDQAEKTEGVECMAYDLTTDHLVAAEAYSNNDIAITAGSQHPERAAMVLDLLKFDTYMYRLMMLGIEGVHYTMDDSGHYYTSLDKSVDYGAQSVAAAWAIKNGDLERSGRDPRSQAISDGWEGRVVVNPTITFVFDDTNVTAYISAVNSVLQDYVPMLELGLVDDADATIDEMLQKCENAGLQNIYDEYYAQYNEWKTTR